MKLKKKLNINSIRELCDPGPITEGERAEGHLESFVHYCFPVSWRPAEILTGRQLGNDGYSETWPCFVFSIWTQGTVFWAGEE